METESQTEAVEREAPRLNNFTPISPLYTYHRTHGRGLDGEQRLARCWKWRNNTGRRRSTGRCVEVSGLHRRAELS